jgi:hypothetical protein
VTGLTRNANLAQDVLVPFPTFTAMPFNGSSDTLTLKISTRVGTNENGTKCSGPGGSHTSATGLRVYLDAVSRASRLRATLQTP